MSAVHAPGLAPTGAEPASLAERFNQATRSAWESGAFEQLFRDGAGKDRGRGTAVPESQADPPVLLREGMLAPGAEAGTQVPRMAGMAIEAKPLAAAAAGGVVAATGTVVRGGGTWGPAAVPEFPRSGGAEYADPSAAFDPASDASPAGLPPAPAAEWAARVVTVAGSVQGAEVYLRDNGLSVSAAIDLASSLRRFFKDQGIPLNRLVINGRQPLLAGDEAAWPQSIYS